jgi:lysophospholipase L1-like esterase
MIMRLRTKPALAVSSLLIFGFCFPVCDAADDFSLYYHQKKSLFEMLPDSAREIVFLGDSITDGGHWAELLGNPRAVNRGISGDVTDGVIFRLNEVTRSRPDKIFLMIGINDLAQGKSVKEIVDNIQVIIKKVRKASPKTELFVQSLLPVNADFPYFPEHTSRAEDVLKVNVRLQKLARTYDVMYIDLYSSFGNGDGKLDPEYTNDGLHLTGSGYLYWKSKLEKYIKE